MIHSLVIAIVSLIKKKKVMIIMGIKAHFKTLLKVEEVVA